MYQKHPPKTFYSHLRTRKTSFLILFKLLVHLTHIFSHYTLESAFGTDLAEYSLLICCVSESVFRTDLLWLPLFFRWTSQSALGPDLKQISFLCCVRSAPKPTDHRKTYVLHLLRSSVYVHLNFDEVNKNFFNFRLLHQNNESFWIYTGSTKKITVPFNLNL